MGVGTINILNAVATGVDMFDCVLPTKRRNGQALYKSRSFEYKKYQFKGWPLDPNCSCRVVKGIVEVIYVTYSRLESIWQD